MRKEFEMTVKVDADTAQTAGMESEIEVTYYA